MARSLTKGAHHIGLAVSRLEASARFFVDRLGWDEVNRNRDYPAIFVSDGTVMVTLWQVEDAESASPFDRRRHVGLHHVALEVESEARLDEVHRILAAAPDVELEFAPELLRQGPAKHMMCRDPSGIRVEFFWRGG